MVNWIARLLAWKDTMEGKEQLVESVERLRCRLDYVTEKFTFPRVNFLVAAIISNGAITRMATCSAAFTMI